MSTVFTGRVRPPVLWSSWVVAALLLLSVVQSWVYAVLVATSALALALLPGTVTRRPSRAQPGDLAAIVVLYIAVVGLMRLAFVGFGTDHVAGLFLSFAAALLLGVAGPVYYTVWRRGLPLSRLGLRRDGLRTAALLALLFGGVQFALTLWGYDLPAPVDWVPLLVMALVVGIFESVFFRGFVQTVLEERFGPVIGVAAAALLYGAYHVGYGMGGPEIVFLAGLGVVYAVAFAIARNLIVLWPLLTPLGSFFANVEAGDIELPWASIAGFVDVFALMAVVLWLAARHIRRAAQRAPEGAAPRPAADLRA